MSTKIPGMVHLCHILGGSLYYLPEDSHIDLLWPKRLRAESTHPENWPKRPTYQGRNDPPPKLAETTQAETTQAETTQGRNDPDSLFQ